MPRIPTKLLCVVIFFFTIISHPSAQYYKVLYSVDSGYSILNGGGYRPLSADISITPKNYNPYDLDGNGISAILINNYSDTDWHYWILDGITFAKKYKVKGDGSYDGYDYQLRSFLGFYDIDGDKEREGVFRAKNLSSTTTSWLEAIIFLNVKTQEIEYFLERGFSREADPHFEDINNDGYIEFIGSGVIIGHSSTNTANEKTLAKKQIASTRSYPNPFTSKINIEFFVPEAGIVNIAIYNSAGKLIRKLVQGHQPAGMCNVLWDGKSEGGGSLAPGEYHYTIKIGEFETISRILLLK